MPVALVPVTRHPDRYFHLTGVHIVNNVAGLTSRNRRTTPCRRYPRGRYGRSTMTTMSVIRMVASRGQQLRGVMSYPRMRQYPTESWNSSPKPGQHRVHPLSRRPPINGRTVASRLVAVFGGRVGDHIFVASDEYQHVNTDTVKGSDDFV